MSAVLLALLIAPVVLAQSLGATINSVDVSQFPKVRVLVNVADAQGISITNLDAQAFNLREDDQPVDGLRVDSIVDSREPVAVALVIDVSGSMADEGKLDSAKAAASAFVDSLGAGDSAAVVSFSNDVNVVQGYTSDRASLKAAINGLNADGETALYDAVALTAQLQGALPQRRKVLVLITDGEDTKSKQSVDAATAATQQAGQVVFAIGLGDQVNRDVLNQMSGANGQALFVDAPDQLRQNFLAISDRLRRQYVLEYMSRARPDDKPHALSLKTNYRGQTTDVKGSFNAPTIPLVLDVRGLDNAGTVSGTRRIDVGIGSGEAQQVELFVDGDSRAKSLVPPFSFQWDTALEKPGLHTVRVRATDPGGNPSDKDYVLQVLGAPASAAAQPTAGPTTVPGTPPARNPLQDPTSAEMAAMAALVLALGLGAAVLILVKGRRPRKPRTVEPPPLATDRTLVVPAGALSEITILSAIKPVAQLPHAKLVVAPGEEVAIPASGALTIGRDATSGVVMADLLASRHHARISYADNAFWVEDLESTNGTRVNGEPIQRRRLDGKEQIEIGDTKMTFLVETP